MTTVLEPVTHQSDRFGWAGWIHWETSGAHFYAWDEPRPFFSVDIYTCKEFDAVHAAAFTADYFDATDLEFEEIPHRSTAHFIRNQQIHELTELLLKLEDRADRHETPFGTYLIEGASVFADIARFTELCVFAEFFGNDSSLMSAEYDAFDDASTHIVVIDHAKAMPAGSVRVIRDSDAGFKSLVDMAARPDWDVPRGQIEAFHDVKLDSKRILDLATAAVLPAYRDGVVSPALYHGLYWLTLQGGYETWIGVGDVNVIEMFWSLGAPFQRVCDLPALPYLDSPASWPIIVRVGDLRTAVREARPLPIVGMLRGAGVTGQVSLPPILLTDAAIGDEVQLATAYTNGAAVRESRPVVAGDSRSGLS